MHSSYDNYILLAIEKISNDFSDLSKLKKEISKKTGLPIPTNADLRGHYEKMISAKKIERCPDLEKALISRAVRTQSGVAVVAVLTKSYPCPGQCVYCPSEKDMPKSYLSNEPAVMRAIDARFDPYRQVQNRLQSLRLNGHATDKIELIVMGGTFSYLPKNYQKKFITECFRAANDFDQKPKNKSVKKSLIEDLNYEQKRNEKAANRIVGLTLETRPDYLDEKEIANFRALGSTRVELGVQSIFDDVLEINQRGHLVQETVRATELLKTAGFKINYHMMPGLLGSSLEKDFQMFQQLFADPNFQPDMLKIYPTVVIKNSDLYNLWKKGTYQPLSNSDFTQLATKIKNETIPPYVRIARLVRDVPETSIEAGPKISNLRQIIAPQVHCQCIRCREVRQNYQIQEEMILDRIDYPASHGQEIFLQYISADKQKLFALLRLRIPNQDARQKYSRLYKFFPVLQNAALIREVHTYGKLTALKESANQNVQHIGLGRQLLQEAERIAREEFGRKKIAVISGVGVRDYYRKNGYRLQDGYMVKKI